MRPFFSYLGGKYSLTTAGFYPIPPEDAVIIEPFAGSAGYSTAVNSKKTILFDCFEAVVLAWQFLINTNQAELDAMPDRVDDIDDFPDLNSRQAMIIRWLLGRAGRRPQKKMSGWLAKEWPSASVWSPARKDIIAEQAPLIRNWEIHQQSYADIDTSPYDPDKTWWFVDPPYIDLKKNGYTFGPDKIDFQHLGDWCRNLPGKVIVCEMDGADWLPFHTLKDNITAANKRSYKEVVWTNFNNETNTIKLFEED